MTVLIEDTEFNIAVRSCRRHDHLHFPFLSFPILLNFARSILLCTAFDSPMTTPLSWPPPRQTMAAPTSSLFFVCGRPTDKRQTEPTNRHSSSCSVSRFVHFPSLSVFLPSQVVSRLAITSGALVSGLFIRLLTCALLDLRGCGLQYLFVSSFPTRIQMSR